MPSCVVKWIPRCSDRKVNPLSLDNGREKPCCVQYSPEIGDTVCTDQRMMKQREIILRRSEQGKQNPASTARDAAQYANTALRPNSLKDRTQSGTCPFLYCLTCSFVDHALGQKSWEIPDHFTKPQKALNLQPSFLISEDSVSATFIPSIYKRLPSSPLCLH